MMQLTKTPIPRIAYQNYHVDLGFRIRQRSKDFALEIRIPDEWGGDTIDGLSINMKSSDLADVNKLLRENFDRFVNIHGEWGNFSKEEKENLLLSLADTGYSAFNLVFGGTEVGAFIKDILDTSEGRTLGLEIVSNDFFLPWELLYPIDPAKELSYSRFIGTNHLIYRKLPTSTFLFSPPQIQAYIKPSLGLLIDDQLPYVVNQEVPFFKRLDIDGVISLSQLDSLDPLQELISFQQFQEFLSRNFDFIHFACHACYDHDNALQSTITLSSEFNIPLHKIKERISFGKSPLIILNACETGNLNPQHTNHFAAAFYQCGARGVIATECAISDAFAADFSQQLYTYLLEGTNLGEALLTARRYFINKYNNPTGLLYAMYARPSIQLIINGEEPHK